MFSRKVARAWHHGIHPLCVKTFLLPSPFQPTPYIFFLGTFSGVLRMFFICLFVCFDFSLLGT